MQFVHSNAALGITVDTIQVGMVDNVVLTVSVDNTAVTGTGCPGPVAVSIEQPTALILAQLAERTDGAVAHGNTDIVGLLVIGVGRIQQIILAGFLIIEHIRCFVDTTLVHGDVLCAVYLLTVGSGQSIHLGVVRGVIVIERHYINAGIRNCLLLAQVVAEVHILAAGLGVDKGVQVNDLHIAIRFRFIQRMTGIHFRKIKQRLIC